MTIRGTSGNDVLNGTDSDDVFDLRQGGRDTANGGDGDDIFRMGAALTGGDKLDGGAGFDIVKLNGDYSVLHLFAADTVKNIEKIHLGPGFDYNLATNNANVAAGQSLIIAGDAIGAANHLIFDGSAETDGYFLIYGGAGADTLTGGSSSDTFFLGRGGNDVVHGGNGNDTFFLGGAFSASDSINGGGDMDIVLLDGTADTSVVFTSTTMVSVERLHLSSGHSYDLTTNDNTVEGKGMLTVLAASLTASDSLTFDGSAEQDGHFHIVSGAGNDSLFGGALNDLIDIRRGGNDEVHSGGGYDEVLCSLSSLGGSEIDGGDKTDKLMVYGDNAGAAVSLHDDTITNFESVFLTDGHDYKLILADGNVAAGQLLSISGAVSSSDQVIIDASSESDGRLAVSFACASDIVGGSGNDTFNISGPSCVVSGGGGDDILTLSSASTTANGDAGNDTLNLSGAFITADGGNDNDTINMNGASGSAIGGAGDDVIHLNLGHYSVTGMGGADTFTQIDPTVEETYVYLQASDSTGSGFDTVVGMDFDTVFIEVSDFTTVPTVINAAVTAGALDSGANFDTELAAAIGAGQLSAQGAMLFTPDSGSLAGHTLLVVDCNGVAGYQTGQDLVINVTGYFGTLATEDFI